MPLQRHNPLALSPPARFRCRATIEIELRHDAGWSVTMEFIADTTEQIYVRPGRDATPDTLREIEFDAVFVPPMTGVGLEEPLLLPPTIEHTLGLGRPGAVLRNVLAYTCLNETAWDALQAAISKLFGYRLLRPDTDGAHILADYVHEGREVRLDIASAGRGFQQVLLLLALLNTRPGAVVLSTNRMPTCTQPCRIPSTASCGAPPPDTARSSSPPPTPKCSSTPPTRANLSRCPRTSWRTLNEGRYRNPGDTRTGTA